MKPELGKTEGAGEIKLCKIASLYFLTGKSPKSWQALKKLARKSTRSVKFRSPCLFRLLYSLADLILYLYICSPMTKLLLMSMNVFQFHLDWQGLELPLIIQKPK